MSEDIITRDSSEFKELRRNIIRAIQAVDILIDAHRPAIGSEVYLTSEEVCSLFGLSKRSLQNYRDNRQNLILPSAARFFIPSQRSINCWRAITSELSDDERAGGHTSCPFLSSYSIKLLGCTTHIRPFCIPKSILIGYLYNGR